MQCGNWDALQLYSCNRQAQSSYDRQEEVAIDKYKLRKTSTSCNRQANVEIDKHSQVVIDKNKLRLT